MIVIFVFSIQGTWINVGYSRHITHLSFKKNPTNTSRFTDSLKFQWQPISITAPFLLSIRILIHLIYSPTLSPKDIALSQFISHETIFCVNSNSKARIFSLLSSPRVISSITVIGLISSKNILHENIPCININ